MHRLGFEENTIRGLLRYKENSTHKSILSHLATSDDLEHMDFANLRLHYSKNYPQSCFLELQIKPLHTF
jgi:alanine racemase